MNKGKIFYINDDFSKIGTDELIFTESNLSTYAKANTVVIRDSAGRIKAAAPQENDDVIRKNEYNELLSKSSTHGDSCDGRNLLTVLGVSTIAAAMAELHNRCNGTGQPDFSDLQIGDYLDLPKLVVDGMTYTWNNTYQNLRIVISGFNQYKGVGDTENTKNHILWTFRNVVLQRQMNASNTNAGGYPASALKQFLDGAFSVGLGSALGSSSYLYPIKRCISKKDSTGWTGETVFLPTIVEVFGIDTFGDDQNSYNTNVQYPIFRNSSFYRVKRYNGSRAWWWCATPHASSTAAFCRVNNGNSNNNNASNSNGGVAPDFLGRQRVGLDRAAQKERRLFPSAI